MARCTICNDCGRCVSKMKRRVLKPNKKRKTAMEANLVNPIDKCSYCTMPLDAVYD